MGATTTDSAQAVRGTNAILAAVLDGKQTHPDVVAFRAYRRPSTTYGTLWDMSTLIAAELARRNDGRRDPIVVIGPKSALTLASFLACLRTGHAFAPMDVTMPQSRIQDVVSQIAAGEAADAAEPDADAADPLAAATIISTVEDGAGASDVATAGSAVSAPAAESVIPDAALSARDLLIQGAARLGITLPADASADATALVASLASQVPTFYASSESAERDRWVSGEDTQYIIFTSGSTGRPKGIEVTATDVANFASWMHTFPVVSEGGRTFIDQAPYSFDLSEYQLVGALTTGGCLYGLDAHAKDDPKLLYAELRDSNADVWVSTPSFAMMSSVDPSFNRELLPNVRIFLFCGETLGHRTARTLRKRFPDARIVNTYGPTESTVAITYCEITDEMLASDDALPVGKPRPGTEIRIMRTAPAAASDSDSGAKAPTSAASASATPASCALAPAASSPATADFVGQCEPGETGEIVIVGDTVAKDYYHNPEKTSAAFWLDQLSDGRPVRAYRTGDLGFLDKDGSLHYLGRDDSLVKVNGFRIEMGDVENNLASLDGIEEAVIVPVRRDGQVKSLRGFVTLDHKEPREDETPAALRERLGKLIPSYMLPRKITVLDWMPLTPNGKIDRKQLMSR